MADISGISGREGPSLIDLRLNAFDHPSEQQTLSTVLVHPAIIAVGELWQMEGSLRKLVIQGQSHLSPF